MLRRTLVNHKRGFDAMYDGWNATPATSATPNKTSMHIFDPMWKPHLMVMSDWSVKKLRKLGPKLISFSQYFMGFRPKERLYRLRRIVEMDGIRPDVRDNCFVAPSAVVIGDVTLHRKCTVGYNAVVRGDTGKVTVGESAVVHDKCVVSGNTTIGKWTTIDPMCVIESADIASCSYVGAGSVVMRGAKIESNAMLTAASILRAGAVIPSGEIWSGNPAEKLGYLLDSEKHQIIVAAKHMVLLSIEHNDSWNLAWEDLEAQRLAREYWAIWAYDMYEYRIRAFYVRDGPKMTHQQRHPNPLEEMCGRMVQRWEGILPAQPSQA